ncbi:hypothetical protein OHB56_31470 [Streptomyces sp. NBC_01635]|uniref:hypothetical protein n=1 Tax=Streptomyces sp. NBC_01635 TaxID=2975904 RepID=UPI00386F6B69|nr:hypothetical protein OHB56_31470 [Streptomyces sp. NBC_01635]
MAVPSSALQYRSLFVRCPGLAAVGTYPGAIVMITHGEGTIAALRLGRVLLLPDAHGDCGARLLSFA